MRATRSIIAELARVLAVLAFGFLAFSPQPAPIERYGVSPAVSAAIDGGAELPGDRHDPRVLLTKACDGCRLGVAVVLPAPAASVDVAVVERTLVRTLAIPSFVSPAPALSGGGPRAPPLTAPV